MRRFSLDGNWRLCYRLEDGVEKVNPSDWGECIGAVVPGNVELDLVRAGIEDDPFYGENIYKLRKYEFYQWLYQREFELPEGFLGEDVILRFNGLDTYGTVWINGIEVGRSDNMLVEHEMTVSSALRAGVNEICVRIDSALNAARGMDAPVSLMGNDGSEEIALLRKAPHSFGWDIAPRILSAGIWRSVELYVRPKSWIREVYYTFIDGSLQVRYRYVTDAPMIEGMSVRVRGICGDSEFCGESGSKFVSETFGVYVPNAKMWYPKGYGAQNLYDVTFELLRDGVVMDSRTERIGFRSVRIERAYEVGREEFKIWVNNTPIMAKGSNWVAVDAFHSRDAERLPAALALLDDIGCNIVRCWGGDVYEDHAFYDFCDEHGILVWQDFSMGCAIYPQSDEFAAVIEAEAVKVVRSLRNHACIMTWAGDNEVDEAYGWMGRKLPHSRYNRITREVLPRVIGSHDPYRDFIPSSPYIPDDVENGWNVPEQHNWGPRDYFKGDFYKHSTAHFISEAGYHGCPSVKSLAKFIPADELLPIGGKGAWTTHNADYTLIRERGYDRNELMTNQVKVMFGEVPEDLDSYAIASQLSQAEAKKFFIETTRLKKWRRTGIIWWNLLDCWPQISDAVVDYYYEKKLAYTFIKRVQQPICLMMGESEAWKHNVTLGNDGCWSGEVKYTVEDGEDGRVLMSGSVWSGANENVYLGQLPSIPGEQRLYLLRWEIDGVAGCNHYVSGFVPFDFRRYREVWLPIIERG